MGSMIEGNQEVFPGEPARPGARYSNQGNESLEGRAAWRDQTIVQQVQDIQKLIKRNHELLDDNQRYLEVMARQRKEIAALYEQLIEQQDSNASQPKRTL